MKRSSTFHWFQRFTASVLLIVYLAGCTHMPTGEKAFDSFDSCFASNLGLAAAGGIGAGLLSTQLAKQFTDNKSKAKTIGVVTGVAATTMIAMTAWRKCAAVYNKSEPVVSAPESQPVQPKADVRRKPGLNLDRLDVKVEGNENDPPVPEFDFSYVAEDAAAKDIPATFRHKVEIVRFKADDNDKLILANAQGDALLDSAGNPIPLNAANKMPRERLHWVTIAEEGKDDYVEDVIIQQGQRTSYRHKLLIPSRAQLPLPLPVPMRYTLTIEAGQQKSSRTVDFALLGTAERPKRYSSGVAMQSDKGKLKDMKASGSAGSELTATHQAKRKVQLSDQAGPAGKPAGFLTANTKVRIEDRTQIKLRNKLVDWLKVSSESGKGGWAPASEFAETK